MRTSLSPRRDVAEFRKRYGWMGLGVSLAFLVLVARLAQLQVIQHEEFAGIARENITQTLTRPALRGVVRDSRGEVLAGNRPAYDLYLVPDHVRDGDVDRLAALLSLDAEGRAALDARLEAVPDHRRDHQIRFFPDLNHEQLAAIETHRLDFETDRASQRPRPSPIYVASASARIYPYGALAAHAIGYLGEIRREELDGMRDAGYRRGDRVGRTGIERLLETRLHGQAGYRRVIRGTQRPAPRSNRTSERAAVAPIPGHDIQVTLDMELMRSIERSFHNQPSGAVVVVDVRTGAVRALFSKPAYNPERFSSGMTTGEFAELRGNVHRPLVDKTVYETFYPGSIFKPFSAFAALANHTTDLEERIRCEGTYRLGGIVYGCTQAHRAVDLGTAIARSCNVFFYHLAERLGLDPVSEVSRDFGFSERTGIGLNDEAAGLVPTRAWYEQRRVPWRLGFALNTAIGQGDTRVTPLQVAMAYAAIANGGDVLVPFVVNQVRNQEGQVVQQGQRQVRRHVHIDPATLDFMVDSLQRGVNETGGTAFAAHIEGGFSIAGKTGTAQITGRTRTLGEVARPQTPRNMSPHAWFAGFGPVPNPRYAIVVLVEHGGVGGRIAAPIALEVMEGLLRRELGSPGNTVTTGNPGQSVTPVHSATGTEGSHGSTR